MAKVNMVGSDGQAFTTSLKNSRVHIANGTASLAAAKPAKKVARKAPAKKAAKKAAGSYRTRALKAK